ncbi:Tankyrase-1 [Bagarius yarrelli]|uniref:Tankyrase-1 n=1 Tax=Bagarius yarrelli TaxID=175774 RepID=A0A556V6Q4_BAGYA|nr:Tankyrase-1 [Bagarius yarrelli]
MATSRRASQQQHQSVSSPPRIAPNSLTPPGSPLGSGVPNILPPAGGEQDAAGDADPNAASSPAPLRSTSSTSSSSTSTSSASSPSTTGASSPDSASTSPASGCASSGAFRELFEACRNGDVSRVKRLVDSVNVNSKDMAGRKSTPLHFAAGFGRKDVVEHLLQTGANVHARDDGGLIPLHNACSFGHAEVVSLLLCQGADPNARDNWNYTPLHEAAIKGKIDVCIVSNPETPLWSATSHWSGFRRYESDGGHGTASELFTALVINAMRKVSCAMCEVRSAMSRSALGSSLCLPELSYCLCFPCAVLLQHGADANIRNTDGKSALDLAEPLRQSRSHR